MSLIGWAYGAGTTAYSIIVDKPNFGTDRKYRPGFN